MSTPYSLSKKVSQRIIDDALQDNLTVSVYDGECTTLHKSRDRAAILAAMLTTDTDTLTFHTRSGERIGSAMLIHKNGAETICDYTDNPRTRAVVSRAERYADTLMHEAA